MSKTIPCPGCNNDYFGYHISPALANNEKGKGKRTGAPFPCGVPVLLVEAVETRRVVGDNHLRLLRVATQACDFPLRFLLFHVLADDRRSTPGSTEPSERTVKSPSRSG